VEVTATTLREAQDLPALPEPDYWSTRDDDTPLFTTDQMRAYARAALAVHAAHIYQGGCPDENQPTASDPDCPACRALSAAQPAPEAGPVAWVDERAIAWLVERAGRHSAHITTKLSAAKCLERRMPLHAAPVAQPAPAVAQQGAAPSDALSALRAVLGSDVGRQMRHKLADGHGTDTPDGRAWLAAIAAAHTQQPTAQQGAEPTDEEIGRVTVEQARQALDSLDDFARMRASVDAMGPRRTLEVFIQQAAAQQGAALTDAQIGRLFNGPGLSPSDRFKLHAALFARIVRLVEGVHGITATQATTTDTGEQR
jgi:hypothetical protein